MVFSRIFGKPKPALPPLICEIDFSLDDDRNTMVEFIRRIELFQREIPAGRDAVVDLSRVQYLGPFAASLILANHLNGTEGARQPRITPPINDKAVSFMHFSGLNHHLFGRAEPDVTHPENVTVPLQIIQKATWNAANPVLELVHKHAVISDDDEIYLRNCIGEVIQNVDDHAKSKFGAVYCARYLVRPQKIRIGIVDRGLGIGTTLAQRYPEINNARIALERVVDGGVSAKSRPNNQGVGISNLWLHVTKQLKGDVFIVTEDVVGYSDRGGNLQTRQVGTRFAGTGVFFTVAAKARVDVKGNS